LARIDLPNGKSPAELTKAVVAGLRVLGEDMGDRLEDTFADALGTDWLRRLLPDSTMSRMHCRDVYVALKTLFIADATQRAAVSEIFGGADAKQLARARQILAFRNQVLHFDGEGGIGRTKQALTTMYGFAAAAGLPCAADLRSARDRVVDIANGSFVPESTQLRSSLARAEAQRDGAMETLCRESMERENDVARLTERATELATERDTARAAQADLERERNAAVARLREMESLVDSQRRKGAADARATARLRTAVAERDRVVVALQTHLRRAADAEADQREVKARLEKAERRRDDAEQRIAEHRSGVRRGAGRAPRPSATGKGRSRPAPEASEIGSAWNGPLEGTRWRLSGFRRSLTRCDDDLLVAAIVGSARALVVVERMLTIRPTGGRVIVRDDGDAISLVAGRWIYLGNIRRDPEVRAGHQPGTVLAKPMGGRRYALLADGTFVDKKTGAPVSGVDAGVVRSVRQGLRELRPNGAFWVSDGGDVTTTVNGRIVYVTRVDPSRWPAPSSK
jgi:hypothetical protein